MRMLAYTVIGLALVVASACGGITVNTMSDPSASFGKLQTYAWDDNTRPPAATSGIDPAVIDTTVRSIVDQELIAKGYRETPVSPDFMVTYRILFTSPGYPYGTLVLDIIDPRSGRIGWTGSAQNVVNPDDPGARDRNIRSGLSKMLTRFPPQ